MSIIVQVVILAVKIGQICIFTLAKTQYKMYNIDERTENHNMLGLRSITTGKMNRVSEHSFS